VVPGRLAATRQPTMVPPGALGCHQLCIQAPRNSTGAGAPGAPAPAACALPRPAAAELAAPATSPQLLTVVAVVVVVALQAEQ